MSSGKGLQGAGKTKKNDDLIEVVPEDNTFEFS